MFVVCNIILYPQMPNDFKAYYVFRFLSTTKVNRTCLSQKCALNVPTQSHSDFHQSLINEVHNKCFRQFFYVLDNQIVFLSDRNVMERNLHMRIDHITNGCLHERHHHHHHHVALSARIFLTLFRHPSLSSIAFGWSSCYIQYLLRAAVYIFELDVLPLLVPGKGSTRVHHLRARSDFSSSVPHVRFV